MASLFSYGTIKYLCACDHTVVLFTRIPTDSAFQPQKNILWFKMSLERSTENDGRKHGKRQCSYKNIHILMKSAYNLCYRVCFRYIPTSYTIPVVLNVRVMTQTRRLARFGVGLFKNRTRKGLIELQLRYKWLATQRSLVTGGCCDSAQLMHRLVDR